MAQFFLSETFAPRGPPIVMFPTLNFIYGSSSNPGPFWAWTEDEMNARAVVEANNWHITVLRLLFMTAAPPSAFVVPKSA